VFRTLHDKLAKAGENVASITLFTFGLVLHLLPLAALVGSLFLADLILDAAGIGLLWGSPFLILWFLFVCFYVADHVQLKVANAATKLSGRN
jgi:hypothetical protein